MVSQDPTYISFSWFAPYDQYSLIQDYKVYWDSGTGSNVFTVLATSTQKLTLWTKDNSEMPLLVPGGYYQFKVSAVNLIGESD